MQILFPDGTEGTEEIVGTDNTTFIYADEIPNKTQASPNYTKTSLTTQTRGTGRQYVPRETLGK